MKTKLTITIILIIGLLACCRESDDSTSPSSIRVHGKAYIAGLDSMVEDIEIYVQVFGETIGADTTDSLGEYDFSFRPEVISDYNIVIKNTKDFLRTDLVDKDSVIITKWKLPLQKNDHRIDVLLFQGGVVYLDVQNKHLFQPYSFAILNSAKFISGYDPVILYPHSGSRYYGPYDIVAGLRDSFVVGYYKENTTGNPQLIHSKFYSSFVKPGETDTVKIKY